MIDKVKQLLIHHQEIERELSLPQTAQDRARMEALGKEYSTVNKNLPKFNEYLQTVQSLSDSKELLKTESDPDMLALVKEEVKDAEDRLPDLEECVRQLLVPKDPVDEKTAILEIRAGTGGDEAGLFAADLYRMYTHFLGNVGLKQEVLSSSYGDLGAIKEIVLEITGTNAYGTLKYESGVHRVQRVPETETQGRVHTSAASVAVFPEAEELDVSINTDDLRIDFYRSGGKGGQNVNKTDSAVRLVHLPTNLVVTCQDEKSQHKNKAKAMKILLSRLYDLKLSEKQAAETAQRRSMVSTGDRSAKIRTYNFSQNRVTDHRINLTIYSLDKFIDGDIQGMIDALALADLNERAQAADQENA